MRNRSLILRKLAKDNLDPKIAYISNKNGDLVPKFSFKKKIQILDNSEKTTTTVDFILPEGAKSIPESLEEASVEEIIESPVEKETNSLKKKSPPTKKKKLAVTAE